MRAKFDGEKFYVERKKKNISQAKLAENANTTVRYVRDLEKGVKDNPSAAVVCQLSNALEISMEALMKLSDDDSQ